MSPTGIYHVVIRGADRQLLFEEEKDFKKYLEILEYYKNKCNFDLYAYCLMSNHVHLLIHTNDTSVSSIFRHINTTYAVWFNTKYQRTGYVQQGRFYSEVVADTKYLLTVLCYIHFNPVKAGLEKACGSSYQWSSFHDYNLKTTSLVDTDSMLGIIGGLKTFHELHTAYDFNQAKCLDIDQIRIRLPDDVARKIISETCNCNTVSDFQNLSLSKRNYYILLLHKKGISIRQLSRLTGIPRGVIQKIVTKGHSR